MRRLRGWFMRLAGLFNKEQRDQEFAEEIESHLQMHIEDNLRSGMTPEDARRRALIKLGGVESTKEGYRDRRGIPALEILLRDIRFGLRQLANNPGFTAVASLTLALGIGANASIFSLVNAALLRDLPVKDPDHLARIIIHRRDLIRDLSYPAFRDLSRLQQVLSGVAASGEFAPDRVFLGGPSEPQELERMGGGVVSANYFSLLGVNAVAGRVFTSDDSREPGEGAVTVISFGLWARAFARDPSVLGRTLILNGIPFTIIGVAPRGFFGDQVGMSPDFWVPILMQPRLSHSDMLERHTASWFRTIARLRPGVGKKQAEAALTVWLQQFIAEEIASGSGSLIARDKPQDFRVELEQGSTGLNSLRSSLQRPLQLLLAIVGMVLLIACCNIANLLLAQGMVRQKEIAVRAALGAGRAQLVRQFVTESALLAIVSGAFGLLIARWSGDFLLALVSGGTESLSLDLHPDLRVFGFTLAVSLLSGILFGLIPALQVTSIDIGQVVQANSRNQRGSRPKQRLTMGLLISQVAISLCLLAGAGLLMRTLQNLKNQDIGVDRNKVLALIVLADPMSIKSTQLIHLRTQTIERLRAIPDVLSVSCSEFSLFGGSMSTAPVRVPDSNVNPEKDEEVRENWVSADYFQTVGMKLRLGRAFTERDTEAAPKVAVINETLSRRYFAHKSPIGKTIYFPKVDAQGRYIPFGPQLEKAQPVQVVGVIQDAKYDDLRESTPGMAFFPIDQTAAAVEGFPTSIEVRTSLNPSAAAPKIRQILKQVNPNLILRSMTTLEDQIGATLVQERLLAKLLGFFGALALVLACVGLYGIMSYSVARRTGEMGIRMALGAQQADVLKIVLREGMLPVMIGVGAGVAAALALTRFLESILYGVRPTDPTTFMLVSLVLIGVALLACYIPARRATKVDPMVALRYE